MGLDFSWILVWELWFGFRFYGWVWISFEFQFKIGFVFMFRFVFGVSFEFVFSFGVRDWGLGWFEFGVFFCRFRVWVFRVLGSRLSFWVWFWVLIWILGFGWVS